MERESVLLVEEEAATRAYLERQLTDDGFAVLCADRGTRALEILERDDPDLVLLDAVLPDASGFELCRQVRRGEPGRTWNRDIPVIMVSERADPVDRVRGLQRGADDYVARPFVYEELLARMRAVLRRAGQGPRVDRIRVRDLDIDRRARCVRLAGRQVELAAKEYELLVALAADPGRVFGKEELLRDVWGYRSLGRTRTLDSHASRLRRKLAGAGEAHFVLNVWGVGYRLIDPGRDIQDAPGPPAG